MATTERSPSSSSFPTLVLASGSPRRRELLARLGIPCIVRPVDLDESVLPGETPHDYVHRLAREKATARVEPGELVLAADTTVVAPEEAGGSILGKPASPEDARAMLRRLGGREHRVLSGLALARAGGEVWAAVASTRVTVAPLTDREIDWYVATGEPADKAGAYGIQGLGGLFVTGIAGDYSNVVGLPVPTLYRLFAETGHDLLAFRRTVEMA